MATYHDVTGLQWLTNNPEDQADLTIRDLCRGWHGRALVVGPPLASDTYSVSQLEGFGMVGIYEQARGAMIDPTDGEKIAFR